ncbi:helix-turn-helix domain-containing protein [Streptomyces sp. NPDC001665]
MVNRKELDPEQSPRAAFGALLRRLREGRGWTQDELGVRVGCSGAHISAVETGRRAPTQRFAASSDRALDADDQLRRACRSAQHRSLLEGFPEYVGHEARAVEIRLYEVGVIPGLLQTHEYASALNDSTVKRGVATREHADERIALIAQRQATLERTPAPLVIAVLDESCLLRPIGSSALMDAQFQRLIEFSELPNTVLQVAPFSIGVRRPMTLPVTVLTMPDRSLISYAESANRGHLERDNGSVVPILADYHQLQAESLPRAASVAMISKLRKGTL